MTTLLKPPIRRLSLLVAAAALLAGANPVLARSANGVAAAYNGKTRQGIAVRLSAPRSFGRAFRYRARMSCSDGSTFLDDYFTDDVVVHHNRFSSHFVSDGGAVVTRITGKLNGRHASGTIRISERYSELPDANGDTPLDVNGGIQCDSKRVKWTATARSARGA